MTRVEVHFEQQHVKMICHTTQECTRISFLCIKMIIENALLYVCGWLVRTLLKNETINNKNHEVLVILCRVSIHVVFVKWKEKQRNIQASMKFWGLSFYFGEPIKEREGDSHKWRCVQIEKYIYWMKITQWAKYGLKK